MASIPSEVIALPVSNASRLRLAVRRLDVALTDQAASLADLRANLLSLSGAARGVMGDLEAVRETLRLSAIDITRAREQAARLAATAKTVERLDLASATA